MWKYFSRLVDFANKAAGPYAGVDEIADALLGLTVSALVKKRGGRREKLVKLRPEHIAMLEELATGAETKSLIVKQMRARLYSEFPDLEALGISVSRLKIHTDEMMR